jgi:hypothetical protein
MKAAEKWGHGKGATVALTDTNLRRDLSVPFTKRGRGTWGKR